MPFPPTRYWYSFVFFLHVVRLSKKMGGSKRAALNQKIRHLFPERDTDGSTVRFHIRRGLATYKVPPIPCICAHRRSRYSFVSVPEVRQAVRFLPDSSEPHPPYHHSLEWQIISSSCSQSSSILPKVGLALIVPPECTPVSHHHFTQAVDFFNGIYSSISKGSS